MYYPAGDGFLSSNSSSDEDFYLRPTTQSSRTAPVASYQRAADGAGACNYNNNRQDVKMDSPDLEKILERTKKSVRAVLMAVKDQVQLSSLEADYYEMYEESIPWRRLQFSNLEDFLNSIPSVCRVRNIGFSTFVLAVTDENTQHIRQMVTSQKRAKGKGKKKGGGRGGGYQNYDYLTYRPPPTTSSALSSNIMKERTEKLIMSTLNTIDKPLTFCALEAEFKRFYQEEIPWRRMGFSSLERYLRSLTSVCKVSGSSVSKVSPAPRYPATPAACKEKQEVKAKIRHPETKERAVWEERLRLLLGPRKFGMLVSQVEKNYEKDWGESLPENWRAQLKDANFSFQDDGVRPVLVKLVSTEGAGMTSSQGGQKSEEAGVTSSQDGQKSEEPRTTPSQSGRLESAHVEVERMGKIVKARQRGLYMSQANKIYLKECGEVFPKDLWGEMEAAKLISIKQEMKIVEWIKIE